jgi:hypothetical protein
MKRQREISFLSTGGWVLAIAILIHGSMQRVQSAPPQTAAPSFRSGAQRSEEVLREILTVLRKIDGRLERIEKQAATPKSSGR